MIVSSIKNRVRFSDENIKNKETREKIEKSLEDLQGIEDIRITEKIGTLLINYDEDKIKILEITDSLKEYIDITEKPVNYGSEENNYINKAVGLVKKGKRNRSSNSGGLINMAVDNFRGNGIVKTAVYGVLGVQGYKNIVGSQGKGKNK